LNCETKMKQIYRVAYLGFSPEMVGYLAQCPDFELKLAVCDRQRVTGAYADQCTRAGCLLRYADTSKELSDVVKRDSTQIDFFVVYKTALIVKTDLLERYVFYNFHPGDLSDNKGAHPLAWTLLLDKPTAVLSLHQINEKIDEGILIDTYSVTTELTDDPIALEKRLEKGVPQLLERLVSFVQGTWPGKTVKAGGYRRKVRPEDFTINEQTDTVRMIIRKIQSQKPYQGAIFHEFYVSGYRLDVQTAEVRRNEMYLPRQKIVLCDLQKRT